MILGETRKFTQAVANDGRAVNLGIVQVWAFGSDGAQLDYTVPFIDFTDPTAPVLSYDFTPSAIGFFTILFQAEIDADFLRYVQTVTVDPVVGPFTYDQAALAEGVGTARGRLATTRLLLADTVDSTTQPAIYTDAEIAAYLALAAQDPYEAAAQAYEGMAASRGRIAQVMSQQGITVHRQALKFLTDMAATMRNRKNQGQLQVGSIDTSEPGELLSGYRREWADFADVPEVR